MRYGVTGVFAFVQTVVVRERVAAIVERGGAVLMVRQRAKDQSGRHLGPEYLTLPGGGVEPDESPVNAVEREVAEEVGLRVTRATFVRRIEHREHLGGATSIYRVEVADGVASMGTDPDLVCDCPRIVGIKWIPAPSQADWDGPDVRRHLLRYL